MQKWDYKIVVVRGDFIADWEDYLKKLGAEGWELVSVDGNFWYLKRPIN